MIYIVLHILCCVAIYTYIHNTGLSFEWALRTLCKSIGHEQPRAIYDDIQEKSTMTWSVYISRYFALPDILHQVMGPGNNEVLDLGGWVPTGYK
jgi:hypothetical protein